MQIARAQIEALRTAGDAEGRYAEDVRELFRIIDWMMHLREDLAARFKQELDELEESLQMPYVTSVERLAKAEGKAEGGATVLLKPLTKLCGALSEELQQRVRRLPIEKMESLSEALLGFGSLDDLQTWLDAND